MSKGHTITKPENVIVDYPDLMVTDANKIAENAIKDLQKMADQSAPVMKILKLRKKRQQTVGKYLTFIRKVYTFYPYGLGYMDLVELLYDGTIGQWSVEQRKNCRGYAATNLSPRNGNILGWFVKRDGKYFTNEALRDYVMSDKIRPFRDAHNIDSIIYSENRRKNFRG